MGRRTETTRARDSKKFSVLRGGESMDIAFKTLIESVNSQLSILRKNGYKIHDSDNLECFISGIRYDSEDDLIKADFQEEK